MAELNSRESVEAWLNARPEATRQQDAVVLSSRAALRVLPYIKGDGRLKTNSKLAGIFAKLIEVSFRATATAQLMTFSPSSAVANAVHSAALSAADSANHFAALFADRDAPSGAHSAVRSAVESADSAALSADFAALAAARSVLSAAHSSALTAAPSALSVALSAAWAEITRDANLIEELGATAALATPLGSPEWQNHIQPHWANMKQLLQSVHSQPPVWIGWYERIMRGGRVSLAEEEAYVLLDAQEIWDQGADAINDAITERLERLRPPEPTNGLGPEIVITPSGFDLAYQPAADSEYDDKELKSLHVALLRRIKRLDPEVQRLKNTQGMLHDEYTDFAAFISNDFKDIDIPTIWSAGTALTDMVDRLEQKFERAKKSDNLSALNDLPDEMILSQLLALTRDFAGFIMGFEQAQKLALRAAELAKLDISRKDQASRISGVIQPMLNVANLLAERSRKLVGMLDRAFDGADEKTVAVIGAGTATASRAVIAFGRAVQTSPVLLSSLVLMGSPLDVGMKLSGDPNWETLRAAMLYLRDNADALAAFANHDPVMRRWLDWIINEIKNAAIPHE